MGLKTEISGQLKVPEDYNGEQNFLTPLEAIKQIVQYYKLDNPDVSVLDPFAGFGTITSEINNAGGNAFGIEIEEERVKLQFSYSNLSLGNAFEYDFSGKLFDIIFTSIPFAGLLDSIFMERVISLFKKVLKPEGKILIDTVPMVERDGNQFNPTEYTKRIFESAGFIETDRHMFMSDEHLDISEETIILEFTSVDD